MYIAPKTEPKELDSRTYQKSIPKSLTQEGQREDTLKYLEGLSGEHCVVFIVQRGFYFFFFLLNQNLSFKVTPHDFSDFVVAKLIYKILT